mmetsp:Transcript_10109/g.21713  ORF Transcript_10109/g.21713 Transcript_10109/m.21713 type:complete len:246 (+) Transcript_10109:516-1253(+)|eukprot:CAMPEP_0168195864 /NCGR_PEP_ID=MMETSP0139_2-20121125/20141_1 /TAXON_ID=44445 /ORGANISM="Pseudo-nitzschia australis, Strain 10249 10 AB" /LENGTH=245 /DNA_ID=CAMNT_0008119863 /DNA_START=511 /DNA_END=1248 /DNA_ORIENTATION=+
MSSSSEGKKKGHRKQPSSGQFYFVLRNPGLSESVRDAGDNVAVIETKRSGAGDEEYEPRPVNRNLVKGMSLMRESERIAPSTPKAPRMNPLSRTLFAVFGGRKKHGNKHTFDNEGAKKVNPKVFFANERTFLKWMNVSVWVAGISIGISSIVGSSARYSGWESWSSLVFLAMAIVISCYSMIQYAKRSLLIVKRSPGPFDDRSGPIVIGSLFVLTFTAQYCIFLASLGSLKFDDIEDFGYDGDDI